MKIIYSILFLSLFACSWKGNGFSAASLKHTNDYVSQIEDTNQKGLTVIYKDSAQMERYQTFDECTMTGKGLATCSPFVYVKKQNDSIYVFSSNTNDSIRLYIKLYNNVWYSHMEYDMWKKKDYIPTKDKLSKIARTYDRFFFNDTILEIKTGYIAGKQYHELIVKCKNNLYYIRNINVFNYSKITDLRRIVNNLISSTDKCANKYTLREEKERYVYEGENKSDSYSYERKAYGLWGIQPGIEETNLYCGIDIREYSDNLERYQHNNSDKIYEVADEMPQYPDGLSKFNEFVKTNRNDSLLFNDSKPHRVILEIVIEKDGRITNAKVVNSIDYAHDNDALSIISNMPKWIPAKQNGNIIRCKMLIPISYKK
jgi:TonB family protein